MSAPKKTTGKIVVIVLLCAVVFFLLLPFLDNTDSQQPGTNGGLKKAIPQIFTSNPLTNLAQKIYNLIRGHSPSQNLPQQIAWIMPNGERVLITPDVAQRYAEQHIGQMADMDFSLPEDASYHNADYFINEEGEWILVKQTSPNSFSRGMHEVNSSDKPYYKYVQQERLAKWTAQPQQPEKIPDSKWARLWTPIKKFFGMETDANPAQATQLAAAHTRGPQANGGIDTNYLRNDVEDINPSFDIPDLDANAIDGKIDGLISPEKVLQETADSLIEMAKETLPEEEAKKAAEHIKDLANDIKNDARAQRIAQIRKDALNPNRPPIETPQAVQGQFIAMPGQDDCSYTKHSAFFVPSFADGCSAGDNTNYEYQSNPAAIKAQRNISQQKIQKLFGKQTPSVLWVFGASQPGDKNPLIRQIDDIDFDELDMTEEEKRERQVSTMNERLFNVRAQIEWQNEGCDKKRCLVVPESSYQGNELRDTAQAAAVSLQKINVNTNKEQTDWYLYIDDNKDNPGAIGLTAEDVDAVLNPENALNQHINISAPYRIISADKVDKEQLIMARNAQVALSVAEGLDIDPNLIGYSRSASYMQMGSRGGNTQDHGLSDVIAFGNETADQVGQVQKENIRASMRSSKKITETFTGQMLNSLFKNKSVSNAMNKMQEDILKEIE